VHEDVFDRSIDVRCELERDQTRFSALSSLRIEASKLEPNVLAA